MIKEFMEINLSLSKTLSRISPSASFTYASTDMAATGIGLFDSFKRGYKRFQDEFREYGEEINQERRDESARTTAHLTWNGRLHAPTSLS